VNGKNTVYANKTVAVVVPAYNEELLVGDVLRGIPGFVDTIVVIDDSSRDRTSEIVRDRMLADARIELIKHPANKGVGAAIVTGYKRCRELGRQITVVMAGDNQMDPADLQRFLDPIIEGRADYVKGNRLVSGEAWKIMPRSRFLGSAVLSLLTKIASGYWQIADFQCGYSAIGLEALQKLELDRLYPRYGYPNHLAVMLNIYNLRVKDVPVQPIYNIGEKSGIRIGRVIPKIGWLLFKSFFWRLKEKYIIRDFHPLVFFYLFGLILFPLGLAYGFFIFFTRVFLRSLVGSSKFVTFAMTLSTPFGMLIDVMLIIAGIQFLLFAMWIDMENNRNLNG
jgi:glycosyltransferase involved in cell wall biosynthesis